MAVKRCPECGHELAGRGRFCLFCGFDLRKASRNAVTAPEQAEDRNGRESDEAFGKSSSAVLKIVLLSLIAVAAAFALVYFSRSGVNRSVVSDKEPVLQAGMSFAEASAEMERCGFVRSPGSGTVPEGTKYSCNYLERSVFGQNAHIITLVVEEGKNGYVALSYYYKDTETETGKESRLFRSLKSELSRRFGDPEYNDYIIKYYRWPDRDGYIMLSSSAGLITVFERYSK